MIIPYLKNITAACYFTLIILATGAAGVSAQRAQLSLDLQINESLTSAQVIHITNVFSGGGRGSSLYTLFLRNENVSQPADNLYFNIRFRSDKKGLLANMYQKQGQPFSLKPGQQVYATSNNIDGGLPGVEEDIRFDGGMTSTGRRFFNDLGGSAKLPPDRYKVQVDIFQGGNSINGGIWVASAEAELGESIREGMYDIYLTSPGDVIGSDTEITNPYPEFRWEGSPGIGYRLVVVEASGQDSPESLLQGALSTEPVQLNGNGGMETQLDYEILDVRLNQASFRFPSAGVQALESGKTYYWQVLTELSSSNGPDIRTSEIWSFTLAGPGSQQALQVSGELEQVLRQFLGNSQYEQLQQDGFRLQSLVIDGEVITGTSAQQRLMELKNKLDQGEISIVVD